MKDQILTYIAQKLLKGESEITYDTALYSSGIMKSMTHLKLINYLERTFDISIEMNKIRIENFNTVNMITDYVQSQIPA